METMRQGIDSRLSDKNRELDELIREKEEINEVRRKLEQEKLVLEIKVSWKFFIIRCKHLWFMDKYIHLAS